MSSVTITLNEREIYELEWLEDCYKRVRFPNPKCEEFLVEINKTLSQKIRGELDNKVKQQALFSLLGEDYVRIHFPHHKYDLSLLEPPKTRGDVKKAYIEEMKQLVQEQLLVTLKDCGYPEDVSEYDNPNDQLGDFLNEVRKVFKEELDLQMDLAKKADRLKDIEADALSAAGDDLEQNDGAGQRISDFMPSQVPGQAFVAAAKHNEQVSKTALRVFREKALMFPGPMRIFLWEDFIYTSRGQMLKKAKSRTDQRKEFKQLVQKKIPKMNRAVQSSDVKTIYSVIIDSYETTKVMKPVAEDDHMLTAAHVINVINVTDKWYSNAQIFWLLPFQLVYGQEEHEKQEDYIIRLSNYLQLFSKFAAISWKDVHAVAADVLETVRKQDLAYFNHIKNALAEKILPIDVYDFAYEILDKDPKKSTKIWKELYKKKKKDWKDRDLQPFGEPAIFVRKWISEAFAGIYGGQTLLFLWDYCFMHGWSRKIYYRIALVTIMLIKPWAMMADNHRKMSRVLFDEPSDLYFNDIRMALMNFKDYEKDIQKLADLNTNIEIEYVEPKIEEPEEQPEAVEEAKPESDEPAADDEEPTAQEATEEEQKEDEVKAEDEVTEPQESDAPAEAKSEEAAEENKE